MTKSVSRRDFMCSLAGCAAVATTVGCDNITHSKYFRSRFKELTEEDLKRILGEMKIENQEKFGVDTTTSAKGPLPGVEFGYALNLSRCTGCRKCVHACVEENNQDRSDDIHWIRVLEMEEQHGIDFNHANPYYDHETVPQDGKFYLPVACQQCRDAPCVKSCPVGATWQEKDGIVVVDYDWCIGCRCCMAGCPYGARRFNWSEPQIPAEELNPEMHYLGNRPRPRGVVEKCTFCIQRVREGKYPACVEICPVGSRKFGNLLDPESEIRYVLENKRVFVLKAEINTRPRFYYYYS